MRHGLRAARWLGRADVGTALAPAEILESPERGCGDSGIFVWRPTANPLANQTRQNEVRWRTVPGMAFRPCGLAVGACTSRFRRRAAAGSARMDAVVMSADAGRPPRQNECIRQTVVKGFLKLTGE
jgi:hypothetical protein